MRQKPIVYLWTDSRIVLHWLLSVSISLKPFVGVRVAEIQSTWDSSRWKFVPTHLNPADDLSRGLRVQQMDSRWMHGPAFLRGPKEEWPEQPPVPVPAEDSERKRPKPISAVVRTTPPIDCRKFSSWQRLVRVTALCRRFIHNLKCKIRHPTETVGGTLLPEEIEQAEQYWIVLAQESLGDWKDSCASLTPFEQNGVIRVGGRLGRSTLPYEQAHPILLPASNPVSKMIMRDTHTKMGHPGSERTLCDSRRQYWIVRGRNLAKETVRNCVVCRKLRQPPHVTLMADLPPDRLKLFSPPFTTTGVDLFGPFMLKYGRNKTIKAWGAVFTCATMRAIHLEIVENLSTPAFLQALRRFVAHHGWPSTIISDNGSSFIGAEKELRKLVKEGREHLQEFAMLHKVRWNFITPLSPHQGGFYESMIKQIKRAIRGAIGQQTLTWNEMSTVFAETQCLVNSRPIGHSSDDPNDPQVLTPNHFLLGRASVNIPQGPYEESRNLHKRFEFVQCLVNSIWKRFIKEYIPTLMKRTKWFLKGRQVTIGDIVLLTNPDIPHGKWDLGRITDVYPGHDGIVRNVNVRTKSGQYKRSVQKCCIILEASEQ